MNALQIDFKKTALVIIDLQKGIVKLPGSNEVVEKAICKFIFPKIGKVRTVQQFLNEVDEFK